MKMEFTEHEENVSQFYSRVADNSHDWNEGFLTFGLWKTKSGEPIPRPKCYRAIYDELSEGSGIQPHHDVLDVACGQGAGMLRVKSQYGCNTQGLDISVANVEIAERRLRDTGVTVTRGSGTKMPYGENSFDYVLCVEGGPNMNSREDFFREAFRVLKPGGKLLMADIIVLKAIQDLRYLQQLILKAAAKAWIIPNSNMCYGIDEYKQKVKDVGFKMRRFELIGDRVIPGYCNFNLSLSVMREQAKIRGPFVGYMGGPIIDIILEKAFSHGLIEYTLVVAEKEINE